MNSLIRYFDRGVAKSVAEHNQSNSKNLMLVLIMMKFHGVNDRYAAKQTNWPMIYYITLHILIKHLEKHINNKPVNRALTEY